MMAAKWTVCEAACATRKRSWLRASQFEILLGHRSRSALPVKAQKKKTKVVRAVRCNSRRRVASFIAVIVCQWVPPLLWRFPFKRLLTYYPLAIAGVLYIHA